MAKAMYIMKKPSCCLHCELRSVIYADGKRYQHCGLDKNGYKLETFFKTEDLKEGFISSYCPLREVPQKKDGIGWVLESEQKYIEGYNACIDEILGGGE